MSSKRMRHRAPKRRTPSRTQLAPSVAPARPQLRFVARALGVMGVLYAAYYFPMPAESRPGQLIGAYLQWQARAAAGLIGWFDPSVLVSDTTIIGRFPIEIVKSCSSLDVQALYVATVLAFPASLTSKSIGLLAGICALTALNLVRIAVLYFVGAYAQPSFDVVHEEILPLLLVLFALAFFAGWSRWSASRSAAHASSPALR